MGGIGRKRQAGGWGCTVGAGEMKESDQLYLIKSLKATNRKQTY